MFPPDKLKMVAGQFTITDENYLKDLCYPHDRQAFSTLQKVAKTLVLSSENQIIASYTKIHFESLSESINPLLRDASNRLITPTQLNLIDIPEYQYRSHPIHLLAYTISYFFKREIEIASIVFEGMALFKTECIKNIFQKLFQFLSNALDKLCIPIHSHIDALLDLDLVQTLTDLINDYPAGSPEDIKEVLTKK